MTLCEREVACALCSEVERCEMDQESHAIWMLDRRLNEIDRRVLVLSNKGGVGKSTVTVNLAVTLAMGGIRIGVLDADLSGPSLPLFFGVEGARLRSGGRGLTPVEVQGLKLVSTGFFLAQEDDPVMWRDSYKYEFLTHLVSDVEWGHLDWLLVDMPPGTGGELIGLRDILSRVDGAIVVTTPQNASLMDARKAIAACREAEIPVLGVVENMSGGPFGGGGGELVAMAMQVPFLGRIPLDPRLTALSDAGKPPVVAEPDTPGSRALTNLAHRLAAAMPLTTR
ncbi:MAG: Mrp/NBP35 family ATP-binding protein [Bacillota bacterium]